MANLDRFRMLSFAASAYTNLIDEAWYFYRYDSSAVYYVLLLQFLKWFFSGNL